MDEEITSKKCTKCEVTKPAGEFAKRSTGRLYSWCRGCTTEYQRELIRKKRADPQYAAIERAREKEYRKTDAHKEYRRVYKQRPDVLAKAAEYSRQYRETHALTPEQLERERERARRRSRERSEQGGHAEKRRQREALLAQGLKICTRCKATKPVTEYGTTTRKSGAIAPVAWCRACCSEVSNKGVSALYHSEERKKVREAKAAERLANKKPALTREEIRKRFYEKDPERSRAYWRKHYQTDHGKMRHRLQSHKRRAGMTEKVSNEQVEALYVAWAHSCAYCQDAKPAELTLDHVVPLAKGGANNISNLVPACRRCNNRKSHLDLPTFLKRWGYSLEGFQARWGAARTKL